MKLDALDKKLLNLVQTDFPIVSRPYKELAEKLNITEEEVLSRLKRLMDADIIRRLGGIFDSRKLGYRGTLCAMKVPADRVDEVAAVVNSYPGITHNYLREHEYNMWFTILADSPQKVEKILQEISTETGITDILNLPAERFFKVMVNFELNGV
ncbi:DNA-binding Lrp family transcriptional regulator [Desulfohalotomaculum tongense]|uniref:siroheme decarboxylase subunit alpha n=1 Tax=Desulforadius tongensis TaxID=1216062 RepID=UPI00195B119D|nr:AsnC family transcriptional regulator [Desulforadius tongensis]MBM7855570.1 DNA-binding Lrp family transcriptional regulator [Desulforadius tongensis]